MRLAVRWRITQKNIKSNFDEISCSVEHKPMRKWPDFGGFIRFLVDSESLSPQVFFYHLIWRKLTSR